MPQQFDPLPFHVDHIVAQKHHGATTAENLALACYNCNMYKGPNIAGIETSTGLVIPLFHPRRDDWHTHFRWEGARLIGVTSVGRVTIEVLQINLPQRVAHRESLIAEGVFPPGGQEAVR